MNPLIRRMHSPLARPLAGGLMACLALIATAALAGPVLAWEGEEVIKDGVPHSINPALPMENPSTIKLEKLWEISGEEEDEYFFGVLTQSASDEQSNVYLLDVQLHQVLVFSPNGEYLRSIGRQGEGPGEFNRPSDLFMTAGGDVAVLQTQPGKIILLSPEGEPRGNHPMPEPEDGGMQMFSSGRYAGDRIVVFIESFSRQDNGFKIISSLVAVDKEGNLLTTYFTQEDTRNFANLNFEEKKMRNNALTWSADKDGRVFASNDFDAYRIDVRGPDGKLERVIERAYEHRVRSAEEIERATPRIRIRSGNRTRDPEVKMSDTDRDIIGLFPRDDGTLWVMSSHGAYDAPDGTIATFDVFDDKGRFTRQITLEGDGDAWDDGIRFDGSRLYVMKGMRSARRAAFGHGEGGDEEVEDEPMSVICYDLRPIIQSQR